MIPRGHLRRMKVENNEEFVHLLQSVCKTCVKKSRFDALLDLLTDLEFLEVQVEEHRLGELLFDFSEAIACLPKDEPGKEVLVAIDEAVRRNRSFIGANPTLLFQCLWNVCWWNDCAQLNEHLEQTSEAQSTGSGKVAKLMEFWREQKEAETDFVWFRSLRPPRTNVNSGNVAIAPIQWSEKWRGDGVVMATSPDGRFVAHNVAASENQTIIVRDASTLEHQFELAPTLCVATVSNPNASNGEEKLIAHACIVAAMAFSRDSKSLTALVHDSIRQDSRNWFVCSWKLDTLSEDTRLLKKRVYGHDNEFYASISSDGAIGLLGHKWDGIWLLDLKTGVELESIRIRTEVTCKPEIFSGGEENGSAFVVCPGSDRLQILPLEQDVNSRDYDVEVLEEELPLPIQVRGIKVAVSPNGAQLAHVMADGSLSILNTSSGRSIGVKRRTVVDLGAICFSPDGKYVVTGEAPGFQAETQDASLLVYDSETGTLVATLNGHTGAINALSWPESADYFLTMSSASTDETIRKWRLPSAELPMTPRVKDHPKPINQLRFRGDGAILEAKSEDGTTLTWDVSTGNGNHDTWISPRKSKSGEISLSRNRNSNIERHFQGTVADNDALLNRIAGDSDKDSRSHAASMGVAFRHSDTELTAHARGESDPIARLPLEPLYTRTVGANHRDLHPNGLIWAGAFGTHVVAVSLEGPGLERVLKKASEQPPEIEEVEQLFTEASGQLRSLIDDISNTGMDESERLTRYDTHLCTCLSAIGRLRKVIDAAVESSGIGGQLDPERIPVILPIDLLVNAPTDRDKISAWRYVYQEIDSLLANIDFAAAVLDYLKEQNAGGESAVENQPPPDETWEFADPEMRRRFEFLDLHMSCLARDLDQVAHDFSLAEELFDDHLAQHIAALTLALAELEEVESQFGTPITSVEKPPPLSFKDYLPSNVPDAPYKRRAWAMAMGTDSDVIEQNALYVASVLKGWDDLICQMRQS